MKKILIFTILISVVIHTFPIRQAYADTNKYLRITDETAGFYSNQSMTDFICCLPYTYYVKILEDLGDVCHVQCYDGTGAPALDGYMNKSDLFSDDLDKSSPYCVKKIKTSTTTPFYTSLNSNEPTMHIFKDRELNYYGFVLNPNGSIYYFVNYNGKAGYVNEEFITPFTINNHPNPLSFIIPEVEQETPTPEENVPKKEDTEIMTEQNIIRMVVILLIIIAGFIAVFISRNPKKRNYTEYTDSDEE